MPYKDKEKQKQYHKKWRERNQDKIRSRNKTSIRWYGETCVNGHYKVGNNLYVTPDGKRSCKICRTQASIFYQNKNRDEVNRKKREHRACNKIKTRLDRKKHNFTRIGWTPELWRKSLKKQKGKCGICGIKLTFENRNNRTRACADHIHVNPPIPRGILCGNCNIGIGNLKDSTVIIEKALKYLLKYS